MPLPAHRPAGIEFEVREGVLNNDLLLIGQNREKVENYLRDLERHVQKAIAAVEEGS